MRNFQCLWCQNFIEENPKPVCMAFLEGIPYEIWVGRISHDKPFDGDNDLQFKTSIDLIRTG